MAGAAAVAALLAATGLADAAPVSTSAPDPTILLSDGHRMPTVALGGGDSNNVTAEEIVRAVSVGFTAIDTAFDYFDETGVGEGIARVVASGFPRDNLFIITKVPGCITKDGCQKSVLRNHESNLEQLKLNYVNLLLVHYPPPIDGCDCAIIREQWAAMEQLVASNKTKSIGVSNYCEKCIECLNNATTPPVVNQFEYHVGMGPDPEGLTSYCKSKGIVPQAYSPLGPTFNKTAKDILIDGELTRSIGRSYNKSGAQVALKWIVEHGAGLVTRASNISYLESDVDLFSWNLSSADMATLDNSHEPFAKPCLFCTSS